MSQRIHQILAKLPNRLGLVLGLFLVVSLFVGCSGSQTTIPNPFNMADRVPPPIYRAPAGGTAQPYYPANTSPGSSVTLPPGALSPGTLTPGALPQGSLQQLPYQQQPGAPLQPSSGFTPQPTFQSQPQPFGALPSNQSTNQAAQQVASKPGDSIAIPTDSTSLRFGSPTAPTALKMEPTYVASNASRPANANSWVSGSAPVRNSSSTQIATNSNLPTSNSLRVRVPGASNLERQPISIASLQPAPTQVQIKPLSTNDPNATVGWR